MLLLDVSNNNGHVDWAAIAKYGVKGGWAKASEGLSFVDALFEENREGAAAHGIALGAYHFAHPTNDPAAEANHFCDVVQKIRKGEQQPVLDLETGHATREWVHAFNQVVVKRLKAGPLFYSNPGYIATMGLTVPVGYGLWLASFGRDDGHDYPAAAPPPWKHWVAHQFTSKGRLPGVEGFIDLSYAPKLRIASV